MAMTQPQPTYLDGTPTTGLNETGAPPTTPQSGTISQSIGPLLAAGMVNTGLTQARQDVRQKRTGAAVGTLGGMGAGAAIGAAAGGPMGMAVGASLGATSGGLLGDLFD